MDYGLRIKQLEVELANLREMQSLHHAHQAWFDRVMETINRTTANLNLLTIRQGERDRNGGQSGQA